MILFGYRLIKNSEIIKLQADNKKIKGKLEGETYTNRRLRIELDNAAKYVKLMEEGGPEEGPARKEEPVPIPNCS